MYARTVINSFKGLKDMLAELLRNRWSRADGDNY